MSFKSSCSLNFVLFTLFLCTPVVTLAQVATDTAPIIEQSTATQNGTLYPFEDYEITSGTPKLYLSLGEIPVATSIGTTTTYLHTDHLNSTTLTTNASGTVTKTLDYYPYGETRLESGTNTETTQYIGEKHDQSTGLNYLNARYLNAKQGRFMSQDPVFLEIGQTNDGKMALLEPQSQNSYTYAVNNPITKKDPTGRCPWCVAVAGVAMYAPQITSYLSALASPLGQIAVSQAVDDAQSGNYVWAAFGALTAGESTAIKNFSKVDNLLLNAVNGARREAQFGKSLSDQFGSGAVQGQVYLRNSDGTIARDAFGSARRLDFAVIKDGKVKGLYEVTSPTANKNAQQFKEQFIRESGGTYIRDRQTGNLIDVSKKPTRRVNID